MIKEILVQTTQQIPLIMDTDVLVIGSRLAGVALASACAGVGHHVMLIEEGTYLGYEITRCMRPWVSWRDTSCATLTDWFPNCNETYGDNQLIPLRMDEVKIRLEDKLLDAHVELLYATRVVDIRFEDGLWTVVIGNKSGRQAIKARYLVDATANGTLQYVCHAATAIAMAITPSQIRRTIEFTGVQQREAMSRIELPASLGVIGNVVLIYPGTFSPDHVYVDIPLPLESGHERDMHFDTSVELQSRSASLAVAAYLTQTLPAFAKAQLGSGAQEVLWDMEFDPLQSLRLGEESLSVISELEKEPSSYLLLSAFERKIVTIPPVKPTDVVSTTDVQCMERSDFSSYWGGEVIAAPLSSLEVYTDVDVLVVGGGTSGVPAATTAAREGVRTALIEMNSRLGGTGTLGGVNAHWMSTQNGYTREIDARVAAWSLRVKDHHTTEWSWTRVNRKGEEYLWGTDGAWNIELKCQVHEEMCAESWVALLMNALLIATLTRGDQVLGVVIATRYGLYAVLGHIIIDATGDGDVAAFAGAEFTYGSARDRMTMWTSLAFHFFPGGLGNNFTTLADVSDVFDYTRFIMAARRRWEGVYEHGSYVAPRESRHILGETVLTLRDQLCLRHYPDTVAVCYRNYDLKGQSCADIVNFGVNPPNTDIEIPLRALLPKSLQNLLIAGKAFSLTHDAQAAPRMQRDLQLLGGVIGLAAAQSVKENTSLRALNVRQLQTQLVQEGNLPSRILEHRAIAEFPQLPPIIAHLTGDEQFEWLETRADEKAMEIAPVIALCCADSATVLPLLRSAFATASGKRQLLLARLLLWHRCAEGMPVVLDEVTRQLACCTALPRRVGDCDFSSSSPDQGIMPEILYLLYALTRVRQVEIMPPFIEIVTRLEQHERDYTDIRAGIFDYINTVAIAAERTGFPAFIPLLTRLSRLSEIQAASTALWRDTDYFVERQGYLWLCLSRALARCGVKEGLQRLILLLDDPQAFIARSAHQELCRITNQHGPISATYWQEVCQVWPATFPPICWEEEIW